MGGKLKGVEGHKWKTSQNEAGNLFFGPIFAIYLELNTNYKISDALLCITSLFKISNHFDHISGVYLQKTIHQQPKMVLSAGKKIFERWELEKYKSDMS